MLLLLSHFSRVRLCETPYTVCAPKQTAMEENDVFGDVCPVQGPNDLNITRNQNLLKGENIADINIFLTYAFKYLLFFFTLWTPSLLYVYTYTHTVTYS